MRAHVRLQGEGLVAILVRHLAEQRIGRFLEALEVLHHVLILVEGGLGPGQIRVTLLLVLHDELLVFVRLRI